jgi:enoyl-CoA hydratase/carnithine racemase
MDKKTELLIDDSIGIIQLNTSDDNTLISKALISCDALKTFVEHGLKGLVIYGVGIPCQDEADVRQSFAMHGWSANEYGANRQEDTQLLSRIENLKIPVVAAIDGFCEGAGLEIALSCHIRMSSKEARYLLPETNSKKISHSDGFLRVNKVLEMIKNRDINLKGGVIDARTAFTLNLVDYLTEEKPVWEEASRFLRNITA